MSHLLPKVFLGRLRYEVVVGREGQSVTTVTVLNYFFPFRQETQAERHWIGEPGPYTGCRRGTTVLGAPGLGRLSGKKLSGFA